MDSEGVMIRNIDCLEISSDYHRFLANEDFHDTPRSFIVNIAEIIKADRLDASYFNPIAKAKRYYYSALPSNWQLKTVRDVTEDVFFPTRFKQSYVDKQNGVPFLSGANITRFTKVGVKYLSKNTKNLPQYLAKPGWILVTRSGTSGIIVYADSSFNDIGVSEHVIRIVPDEKEIDSGFLFAILSD